MNDHPSPAALRAARAVLTRIAHTPTKDLADDKLLQLEPAIARIISEQIGVDALAEALDDTWKALDTLSTFYRHSPTWQIIGINTTMAKAQAALKAYRNPNNKPQ